MWGLSAIAGKAGRPEYGSTRTAQYLGSDCFASGTCCKPSRPVLIASPPFIAALLIGLKGVLNPKVQVQPVAASRFNHSAWQTSSKMWRSRCHRTFIHRNLTSLALSDVPSARPVVAESPRFQPFVVDPPLSLADQVQGDFPPARRAAMLEQIDPLP